MNTRQRASFQSLIDTHENPVVLIDAHYRIVAANHAYREAYGVGASQLHGRCCYEISHRRESPCHLHGEDCPHQHVFATGAAHQVLHTHYDAHGQPEHVRIKGHAVLGPDGARYLAESITRLAPDVDLDCDQIRMIGRSPALLRAVEQLSQAARAPLNVLLEGESGVGKELAAHFLHQRSARSAGRFVAVDCATLGEALFESEMFGHERGAFTGCTGRKLGLVELAHGGTLFLDEAGNIPLIMQAKLLRVLESGEFRRIGGAQTLHSDVRVVAASNRDLRQMVAAGGFREDLYYRLASLTVRLPPLRERREDIPALAEALLQRIVRAGGVDCRLAADAQAALVAYGFPGNVRELRNVLQRAVALCQGGVIRARDLQLDAAVARDAASTAPTAPTLRELERAHMAALLTRFDGHRRRVAEAMGISERTLYRKLRQYGMQAAPAIFPPGTSG